MMFNDEDPWVEQGNQVTYDRYYAWKNNVKRETLYRRHCRIVVRLTLNSLLIEFADGQREVVSRFAVRRLAP